MSGGSGPPKGISLGIWKCANKRVAWFSDFVYVSFESPDGRKIRLPLTETQAEYFTIGESEELFATDPKE